MIFFGIDQSISSSGICIVNDKSEIIRCETIQTSPKSPLIDRMDMIAKRISFHLDDPQINNQSICIIREGYSYGSKSSSLYQIGELGGVINYNCFLYRGNFTKRGHVLKMYTIPPTTVKKFCLGNGSIKKDSNYLLRVSKRMGIEFSDDNQADAYMICKTFQKTMLISQDINNVRGIPVDVQKLLIASSIRKKMKITDSSIREMSVEDIAYAITRTVNEVYGVF